jgi:hypothetical protein
MYCGNCDIPICSTCVTSGKHERHRLSDILEILGYKTQNLQKDLEELETIIYPQYEKMASDCRNEKAGLETMYRKLIANADLEGEILHREITTIVNQRKSNIAEMKAKHLAALNKNTNEITNKMTELRHIIQDQKIVDSNDVKLTSTYQSRNAEFRTLPAKVRVTLPSLSPQNIHVAKDHLNQMFGSLSPLSVTKEPGYRIKPPDVSYRVKPPEAASPPVKPLLDEPRLTATIDTGCRPYSVICHGEEQVWTRGKDEKIMKLHNLQGKVLKKIETKSGNVPLDIAVTRNGDLVYTDDINKSVNLVNNKQIQPVVTLQGWAPLYVCCTTRDDLLVTMLNDDENQSKVVRYSGSTETQTIQFDDQGHPLYSSGNIKYISENRNLDVCVSDNKAKAVVVVNRSGKLRFKYTGNPSHIRSKNPFDPVGITTDSQCRILIADYDNHCIQILHQDGQFLRYIHNCDLRWPWSLCVDIRDNLFVANGDNKVKIIQYS